MSARNASRPPLAVHVLEDGRVGQIWHALRYGGGRPTDTYCGYPSRLVVMGRPRTEWADVPLDEDKCNDCAEALRPPAPPAAERWEHLARSLYAADVGTDYPWGEDEVAYALRTYGAKAREWLVCFDAAHEWAGVRP
jgi:hypothetical protein